MIPDSDASSAKRYFPHIYESIIVWREGGGGIGDICGYNIVTDEEFVVKAPEDQTGPAIYEDTVVWTDYRNNDYDIYGCFLSTVEWYPSETPAAQRADTAPAEPPRSEIPSREFSPSELFYGGFFVALAVIILLLVWMGRKDEERKFTRMERKGP